MTDREPEWLTLITTPGFEGSGIEMIWQWNVNREDIRAWRLSQLQSHRREQTFSYQATNKTVHASIHSSARFVPRWQEAFEWQIFMIQGSMSNGTLSEQVCRPKDNKKNASLVGVNAEGEA